MSSSRGMDPFLSIGSDFFFITPFSVLAFSRVEQLSGSQMVVVGLERPRLQLVASSSRFPSAPSSEQFALGVESTEENTWEHLERGDFRTRAGVTGSDEEVRRRP